MEPTLNSSIVADLTARLETANSEFAASYPGESASRQPVHTVYGGAHLFRPDTAARLGEVALRTLERFAPSPEHLAQALAIDDDRAEQIYTRVVEKLEREPVEDFRLDFEDGYGNRPDDEEDDDALSAARAVYAGVQQSSLPPFLGMRIKPLTGELSERALRTLDLFLSELSSLGGDLPANFVITLPKVPLTEHVAVAAEYLDRLEAHLGLGGQIPLEIMIETTQSIFDQDGSVHVRRLVAAGNGRTRGAHFGTYDYTASCSITAAHQHMVHPACDFARHVMQVALAGTGVWLSDGATNIMPVAIHRAEDLDEAARIANRRSVHNAWKLHFDHIQHSLVHGFYQGWDLHPAQLITRYAAVYDFFLSGVDAAGERLRNFIHQAAQATLVGEVFDDAATGQGLLNFFIRATNSGAVTADEASKLSGLSVDELQSRSFHKILDGLGADTVRGDA